MEEEMNKASSSRRREMDRFVKKLVGNLEENKLIWEPGVDGCMKHVS
jgi:hypothetical protein